MDPASSNNCVSQRQFDPLYASDAENLRVVGAKLEEVRHCRHYMKVPMSVQQEPGIVSRLFVVCTQSLQCITQAADPTLLPKRDLNALRRSFSTLLLWGEGYGAQTGALDSKLKRSRHLYCTTLSLLRSLCGILEHGLVEIVPRKSDRHKTIALRATCRDLYDESARLLRYIRQKEHRNMSSNARPDDSSVPIDENSDKDSDEDSDTDTDTDEEANGSDHQTKLSWFASFVADVSLYMSCLTDLGTALEFPALHHEHSVETEPVVLCANHVAIEANSPMGDKRAESAMVPVDCASRHINLSFTETDVTMAGKPIPVDAAELENMENQQTPLQPAVPVSENCDDLQPFAPKSLHNWLYEGYEDTFAVLDASLSYKLPDFEDGDQTWALQSRPSGVLTPELSTSADSSLTEHYIFRFDGDSPAPWKSGMYDNRLSFDVGVSDHLESLGTKMLPMEPGAFDTYLSNSETTEKQMECDLVDPKGFDATPDHSLPLPYGAICDSPDVDNTLKCKETVRLCSVQCFSTQKELDAHIGITNLDNSLNFAPESVTDLLGVDEKTGGADADATAPTPVAEPVSASTTTHLQQYSSDFARPMYPPFKPADPYPPCNTLYVGNLPIDTSEDELKAVFSKQRGYKRLCFRIKHDRPMCFVEFEDTSLATKALTELHGCVLKNSIKGGIHLSYSKNPLGVRSGSHASLTPRQPTTAMLSSSILASYGISHDLRERILRPVNACAWEQHGREVTSAGYRSYGGKAAIAVAQKDGKQKHEGTSSSSSSSRND